MFEPHIRCQCYFRELSFIRIVHVGAFVCGGGQNFLDGLRGGDFTGKWESKNKNRKKFQILRHNIVLIHFQRMILKNDNSWADYFVRT